MNLLKRSLSFAEFFMGVTGLAAILLTTLGVFTRFVLKVSIAWSDELLRTIFVWAYFIGTALLYRNSDLMRLELLDEMLKKRGKLRAYRLLRLLQSLCVACFSGIVGYYGYVVIMTQVNSGQMTTTSNTPAWVSPLGFLVGTVLLVLFSLEQFYKYWRKRPGWDTVYFQGAQQGAGESGR